MTHNRKVTKFIQPTNIRKFVWKIIDTDLSLKKDLARGLINNRALASHIISTYKLKVSIDSVISAIRRYNNYNKNSQKEKSLDSVLDLLKQSEIKTITKMASISLKKNEETTQKLSKLMPKVNFEAGETLRILEGAKLFKLIINQHIFKKYYETFNSKNVIGSDQKIGMIEMIYPNILQEIPGVFSIVSTELASNNISIIDALICSNEHIIVVDDKNLLKAFEIVYKLCN